MGHKHLIRLPATKKWNEVVELLVEGAELETIAAAAAEAAESSLPTEANLPASSGVKAFSKFFFENHSAAYSLRMRDVSRQ